MLLAVLLITGSLLCCDSTSIQDPLARGLPVPQVATEALDAELLRRLVVGALGCSSSPSSFRLQETLLRWRFSPAELAEVRRLLLQVPHGAVEGDLIEQLVGKKTLSGALAAAAPVESVLGPSSLRVIQWGDKGLEAYGDKENATVVAFDSRVEMKYEVGRGVAYIANRSGNATRRLLDCFRPLPIGSPERESLLKSPVRILRTQSPSYVLLRIAAIGGSVHQFGVDVGGGGGALTSYSVVRIHPDQSEELLFFAWVRFVTGSSGLLVPQDLIKIEFVSGYQQVWILKFSEVEYLADIESVKVTLAPGCVLWDARSRPARHFGRDRGQWPPSVWEIAR